MKMIAITLILIGVAVTIVSCTFIGWNKGPVTVSDSDSHAIKGSTNARQFDTTISPK